MADNLDSRKAAEAPATAGPGEELRVRAQSPSPTDTCPERAGATHSANGVRTGRNAARPLRSRSGSIGTAWRANSAFHLTRLMSLCYGAWLKLRLQLGKNLRKGASIL